MVQGEKGLVAGDPDIEVAGLIDGLLGRIVAGLARDHADLFGNNREAPGWIRLRQRRFGERIVALIGGVEHGEEALILERAGQYLGAEVPDLLADAGGVGGRRRDRNQQRLQPLAERGQDDVIDARGAMAADLVEAAASPPQPTPGDL